MSLSYRLVVIAGLAIAAASAGAQQSASSPTGVPSVTFKFYWDQGRPWVDYTITVAENGATHFSGNGNPAEDGDGDSFRQDFTMSEANRQKIFEWAKAANYFQGQFEAKQKNVAKTGTKTLEYQAESVNNSTTYNYSPNPNIQQITKLFQSMATTLDYGRKLAYQYRFDKLGMDARLKELVDLQATGYAQELQAIAPVLSKIATDPDMMHIARQEARALLKSANAGATLSSPASQP